MPWQWGSISATSLSAVEGRIMHYASVVVSDPRLPYTVVTDASGSAAGGVLMQDQGNGLQPLAFLSRQLKPTKQRYSVYERELVVVAYCLQSWRHYLEGCLGGVTMITDHQLLMHYMDQPVLSWVQTRWLRLGLFQSIRPTVKYQARKGQYSCRCSQSESTPNCRGNRGGYRRKGGSFAVDEQFSRATS